jgi:leucyl-tRNA synthetase
VLREAVEALVLMLSPFTPHMCEELWERLGHSDGVVAAGWPAFDEAKRTLDRLAGSIENAPLHYDDFALGMARRSIDKSQVICRNRVLNRREVRSKNLMRRMLRRRND